MRPEDDLPAILAHAWTLLVRGGADRKSPVHTPVIASVDENGLPHARVMVLRKADPAAATLRLHTDARSPKVAQLNGKPVAVLAYHPAEQVQLRIAGTARVLTDDEVVDGFWGPVHPLRPPLLSGRTPARHAVAGAVVRPAGVDRRPAANAGSDRAGPRQFRDAVDRGDGN